MDKNQEYYQNRNNYEEVCIPRRENILNYLIKEKFLSEFSTEEEKEQVLNNLGIIYRLNLLQQLINNKSDLSALNGYVTYAEFLRRFNELDSKDEKSKGYYSSYEDLISNNLNNSVGDWAIVNVDGSWYIYKFGTNGWEQSGTYDINIDLSEYVKLSDLSLYQTLLTSGVNIKTINGQSILGEGNIQISGGEGTGDLSGYVTKEELYNIQNPLKVTVTASPQLLEYTGQTTSINIGISAKKGNASVNPQEIILRYDNNSQTINSTSYSVNISKKGITTFYVTCTYNQEKSTGQTSVNFVLPTYLGFSLSDNSTDLNLSLLSKKIKSNIQMQELIQNSVYGSYLWIVSPFTLNKVATDAGYTYEVKMLLLDNKDGLYYYRSNSAVDISHLTYYIK